MTNNWFSSLFSKIFSSSTPVESVFSAEDLQDTEDRLLQADFGLELTEHITTQLASHVGRSSQSTAHELVRSICTEVLSAANPPREPIPPKKLQIILIVGINGGGKTTTIGKLAHKLREKRVLLAPCDTFRAAAPEQLAVWAERSGADIYIPQTARRPDSVLYEAIEHAKGHSYDYLLVDTAGRLQNKRELMDELARISKVIDKHLEPDISVERWLVVDATTGQNGMSQALLFGEVAHLDGIVLSKFDSSSKGGIIFAISHRLRLRTLYLGVGEGIDLLLAFSPDLLLERVI